MITSEPARGDASPSDQPPPASFDELDLLLRYADALPRSGSFVDVGAHIGRFSEAFASHGWHVIAIEPAPELFAELGARLTSYPRAEVISAAAFSEPREAIEFYLSDEFWGLHSLRPFDTTHRIKITVPAVTLTDILSTREIEDPLIVKIDTEGADLEVLRGLDTDTWRPQLIMCEFMDERTEAHFGYSYTDIIDYMTQRGYDAYVSEWAPVERHSKRGEPGGPFTHLSVVRPPLFHPPAWGNLLFLQGEDVPTFEGVLISYLRTVRRAADAAVGAAARLHRVEMTLANRELQLQSQGKLIDQLKEAISSLKTAAERDHTLMLKRDERLAELTARNKRLTHQLEHESTLRVRLTALNAGLENRIALLLKRQRATILALAVLLASIILLVARYLT